MLQLAGKSDNISTAIDAIYKGDKQTAHKALFDIYNSNYHNAITDVDEERAKMFKNNLSRLAAAKAAHAVNDINRQLADSNGEVRSKESYTAGAKKVANTYNRFQSAEYNTCVHRCRVAKQWEQFEKESDLYPNIEWVRTRSATPRELHLEYAGRIWPMEDPVWRENQPGCLWNCKCSMRNTDQATTDNSGVKFVKPSQGLEGNPYYTNEIITDQHPYFQGVSPHIPDVGVLENPDDIVYLDEKTKAGSTYQVHFNCLKEKETEGNREMIPYLFDAGFNDVKLLPRINAKEIELRDRYYGKAFNKIEPNKCPDAMADGTLIEFKQVSSKGKSIGRNIQNAIKDAADKSDVALVKIRAKLSKKTIESIGNGRLSQFSSLKKIIIVNNGKSYVFAR